MNQPGYDAGIYNVANFKRLTVPNSLTSGGTQSDERPAALALAHLALAAAAILARAAALIFRFEPPEDLAGCFPFTFAQRALCAAAIRARALALIVLLPAVA